MFKMGLRQGQSWMLLGWTLLLASSGPDLSWKQTIFRWQTTKPFWTKWRIRKLKNVRGKLSKMSRADLEEEYVGDVPKPIKAYEYGARWWFSQNVANDLKLCQGKRYNEVKDDHLGLLPSELPSQGDSNKKHTTRSRSDRRGLPRT